MAALVGIMGSARLAAESPTDTTPAAAGANGPQILSGQKPRLQDFFPGGNATFTVSITNTGSIALSAVSVTDATSPDCNRNDLGTLEPGQSTSFTCTRNAVGQSYLNVLTANGTSADTPVSHQSNAFVKVHNPDLRISKTPQAQTIEKGGTAHFNVTIFNTSDFPMLLEEVDDALIEDCDRDPTLVVVIPAGDSLPYVCSMTNVQESIASIITVTGRDLVTTELYRASDIAWIDMASLQATMTSDIASLPEPGGLVTYNVALVNTGSPPLTIKSLNSAQFGNLLDAGNDLIEAGANSCLSGANLTLLPNGGTFTCSFVGPVNGQPSQFVDTLTASAVSRNNVEVVATADAAVTITNVPSSMTVSLGAEPSFINPPSRPVNFSVQVVNTSPADAITITEMTDEFLGNLDGEGTCELPVVGILPGFSYQCQFTAEVSGQIGQQRTRTVNVKAVDDDPTPNTLTGSGAATVSIIEQPLQQIFMPNVTDDNDPVVEPNNSCANAHPMSLNRQYFVRPPAKYPADQDYYVFELTQSHRVTIELTNFVPRAGQMVIRYDDTTPGKPIPNCEKVQARRPQLQLNNTMDLGQLPQGRYYIQIINDGPSNVPDLYGLITRTN